MLKILVQSSPFRKFYIVSLQDEINVISFDFFLNQKIPANRKKNIKN